MFGIVNLQCDAHVCIEIGQGSCRSDRPFYLFFFLSSLVLEIWSFTAYFSGKRRSLLHRNTVQGSFFPLQSDSKKTLRKNVPKSA